MTTSRKDYLAAAYTERVRACNAADAEYERVRDATTAEGERTCNAADAECLRVRDGAYADFLLARDAADAEHSREFAAADNAHELAISHTIFSSLTVGRDATEEKENL